MRTGFGAMYKLNVKAHLFTSLPNKSKNQIKPVGG